MENSEVYLCHWDGLRIPLLQFSMITEDIQQADGVQDKGREKRKPVLLYLSQAANTL